MIPRRILLTFTLLPLLSADSRHPVQPAKYLEASGSRGALLGRQDGTFEAWLFPLKILREFRLAVYVDGGLEPVALADMAEQLALGDDPLHAPAIEHVHAAFRIRQTWVASHNLPVLGVLLDIDTSRPLRLRASFIPEMKPMWPASFGGQSTSWDAKGGTLAFTEGLRRFRPVLGSPAFAQPGTRISEQVGHQLPERTVMIEFDVTPEVAGKGPVPIVLALTRDMYQSSVGRLPEIAGEGAADTAAFLARTTSVEAPALGPAFRAARLALNSGWACNDGAGCGLIAGWGASGLSERPGFGWYFGGDALMNTWAVVDYGDFARARAILEFLIHYQREDGRIPHELTQSMALLDWSKYPYGYYHADTTPLFLFTVERYVRRSGDREFLEANWPRIQQAWKHTLTYLGPDGLLSNERGGAAAVETGALSGRVAQDVYLQGVWLGAARAYRQLALWLNKSPDAAEADARYAGARESIGKWFVESKGWFSFARLKDGTVYDANSGWQGFLLAHGAVEEGKARAATASLSKPELMTRWGTRLFATDSPFYDALGYNDGSVWPFVTAFAAMAEFTNGQPASGYMRLLGLAEASRLSPQGFLTEYFSGDRFAPLPRSVPHQLFSSMAVAHPLISGLLGLDGDAIAGTLRIAPQLPCGSAPVRFERFRVGQTLVSGEITPQPTGALITHKLEGPELQVSLAALPCFEPREWKPLLPGGR